MVSFRISNDVSPGAALRRSVKSDKHRLPCAYQDTTVAFACTDMRPQGQCAVPVGASRASAVLSLEQLFRPIPNLQAKP
eukprot:6176272-Pleurochrysis_carterae.AAC.4